MTIVQRRVFYGKVGTADSLVEWAKGMYGIIASQHEAMVVRIMTDHQSGRTDRLAVEIELESFRLLETIIERTMSDPNLQPKFAEAFSKLSDLIEYAEVEQWTVH